MMLSMKKSCSIWLVSAFLVFSILALVFLPPWQVKHVEGKPYKLAELEDEHRRTLAQILGGLWILYGLYLTGRRVTAAEDNVRVAQDNVRVAEEGHITERFTQAIAQLGQEGDDKMAIRLGGIYALERIAKDSEKDHGPIMEVLTAYVRERAPRKESHKPPSDERPPTDIQAILTVIGRRETTGKGRRNDRLDLSKTHLVGAILPDANLREAILSWADLRQANLSRTHLEEAGLFMAKLNKADLPWAFLNKAYLLGAELNKADLTETHLEEAEDLTEEQVLSAKNWEKAYLPDYLQYLLKKPPA